MSDIFFYSFRPYSLLNILTIEIHLRLSTSEFIVAIKGMIFLADPE